MGNKVISGIVALVVIGIIVVIVLDFSGNRPDKLGKNPYSYDIEEYKAVDPFLIGYKETRNFPLKDFKPTAMDIEGGQIWLAGNGTLQSLTFQGVLKLNTPVANEIMSIEVTDAAVYVALEDRIRKLDRKGIMLQEWETPGRNCMFTSVAAGDSVVYVADAGNRRVLRYDPEGKLLGTFEGKSESSAGHGFIVPSASFDLVINSYDELWVVNPGKHAIENYSPEGELRGFWQKGSMTIEGFSGCCNPAHIAVLSDASFVTSEKGLVRIKVYEASGEMRTVVAPPAKFKEEGRAPAIAVDENDVIYALDFDRNTIRVFEKI